MKFVVLFLCFLLGCVGVHPAPVTVTAAPVTVTSELGPLVPDAEQPKAASVVLHADKDFTVAEREVMYSAAAIWSRQTSGVADIQLVFDVDFESLMGLQEHVKNGHNLVLRAESWMDMVIREDASVGHGVVLGWMTAGGIHNPGRLPVTGVFVEDRLEDRNVALQTVIHEFGHVLGLPHVPSVQSIMYPGIIRSRKACLKRPDLAAFCQVNDCGTSKMLPCE